MYRNTQYLLFQARWLKPCTFIARPLVATQVFYSLDWLKNRINPMEQRKGSHTVSPVFKYCLGNKIRYHVLTGELKARCRELIRQICEVEDVRILDGVVSKDHYPSFVGISAQTKH
jgi:Transposase IS200 like